MALKTVTVSAEGLLAPAGADAGSGIGILGALLQFYNALVTLVENCAFTAAGVAMATTTTAVKTVNSLTYLIEGVFKVKAGTDNFWTAANSFTAMQTVPIGSRCIILLLIDAAGAASAIQGPIGTTDLLATVPVDTIPQAKAIVGTVKVVTGTANFVPGTDAWNKANVAFTFADGYDASMVGCPRILTRV
jgi:hypothetical protein